MKPKYYYLRDGNNRPVVSVCLLAQSGDIARGVAICSPLDCPNKKRGRDISFGRAIQAFERGTGGRINREEAAYVCDVVEGANFTFKSHFNPPLFPMEQRILGL